MNRDYFSKFLGNEALKSQLSSAIETERLSHCYMFCGEKGLGKKTLAKAFAQAILCENETTRPCGGCQSCIQIEREDHPDVIYVDHEKPTLFSVDEVRDFSRQMSIRPYKSKKKIFILKDAHLLNMQAQNAMLKTIEEPPSYGMILLLTENKDVFLPTVLSRCIEMDLQGLQDSEIKRGLMAMGIADVRVTDEVLRNATGNLGRALSLLTDEELIAKTDRVGQLLRHLPEMPLIDLWKEAQFLGGEKEDLPILMSMMRQWYRDVNVCQAAGGIGNYAKEVRRQAGQYHPTDFPRMYEAMAMAERQRRVNVNPELVMEMMLLKLRPSLDHV